MQSCQLKQPPHAVMTAQGSCHCPRWCCWELNKNLKKQKKCLGATVLPHLAAEEFSVADRKLPSRWCSAQPARGGVACSFNNHLTRPRFLRDGTPLSSTQTLWEGASSPTASHMLLIRQITPRRLPLL